MSETKDDDSVAGFFAAVAEVEQAPSNTRLYPESEFRNLQMKLKQSQLQSQYWKEHGEFLVELVIAWKNRALSAEKWERWRGTRHQEATTKAQSKVDEHDQS